METWNAIVSRRNVREFADRPIGDEDLDRILEAGRRAPSSRNWQPWEFVVVTDRAQLGELSQVWRGGAHIAHSAATVVIVLPRFEDDAARLERAAFDAGQASLQMMVAAADLGIGSGHSAVGDQDRARELLGFPEDRVAYIMIDFGYPSGRPLQPIRRPDRRPFEEVVHRGRW
ncbi:MAG TPA: nitroreductase family protein [Solirubrobacteraceae bacterium]|nr:nitroreductase family protein [Solirubrobacteraceae bacterium]